jgi:tetratricopeptide (TPR) repeat protein
MIKATALARKCNSARNQGAMSDRMRNTPRKCLSRAIFMVAVASLPASAIAQLLDTKFIEWCAGKNRASPEQAISGCTALIERGQLSLEALANVLERRGEAYYGKDRFELALKDFSEAIRLDPNYGVAYIGRAKVYYIIHQYDRSILDSTEAVRLNPKLAKSAHNLRAQVYFDKGDYGRAIADFDAQEKVDPDSLGALSYYLRGLAKQKMGNVTGANLDIKSAKTLDPKIAEKFKLK